MACCIPCCIPCCCPCGSSGGNNQEPTFCGRVVEFISGVLCFPYASLKFAAYEYRAQRSENTSRTVSVLCAIRSFIVPVPLVGAIVFGIARMIRHIYGDTKLGMDGAPNPFIEALIYVPLVGAGLLSAALLGQS